MLSNKKTLLLLVSVLWGCGPSYDQLSIDKKFTREGCTSGSAIVARSNRSSLDSYAYLFLMKSSDVDFNVDNLILQVKGGISKVNWDTCDELTIFSSGGIFYLTPDMKGIKLNLYHEQ